MRAVVRTASLLGCMLITLIALASPAMAGGMPNGGTLPPAESSVFPVVAWVFVAVVAAAILRGAIRSDR